MRAVGHGSRPGACKRSQRWQHAMEVYRSVIARMELLQSIVESMGYKVVIHG